ncbi:MAG: SPOR domain-containing protein [Pseudobdellovibrionaceae bacterium]
MKNNVRGSAKTDTMVKLVLVFFISLLSFSIGTFVGKKFSDSQHKIAKLEPGHSNEHEESHDREVASVPNDHTEVKAESHLSDDEIAKLAKEFVSEEEAVGERTVEPAHAQEAVAHAEAPTSVASKMTGASSHSTKVAVHKEEHAEPKKTAAETRIPSSLPQAVAPAASGKFTVQVASYSTETEAQKFASDLKGKGYSAFYIPAKVRGQNWYRVNVGLFSSQDEAQVYRAKLMTEAKISAAIIQKITN